jgi:sedoheptulokinase
MAQESAYLGIDIGTSKIAAALLNDDYELLAVNSCEHNADLAVGQDRSEQNVNLLLGTVWSVLGNLPSELLSQTVGIGVTGQMHGLTLLNEQQQAVMPLITWQDKRCLADGYLKDLNQKTGADLHSGFGCASLAWLLKQKQCPSDTHSVCTVQDLLVSQLCALPRPIMDPTHAASWGLFDVQARDWKAASLQASGIPREWLPKVVPCGVPAGVLAWKPLDDFSLPFGIPVITAIGDNQASLLGTVEDPDHELALTLGTGGQLSAVTDMPTESLIPGKNQMFEYRPFLGDQFLAVAASLSGGSAWKWLAQTVEKWLSDLALETPGKDAIYARLNQLGLAATEVLNISPNFLGERYDETLRGAIRGIDLNNFDLGHLSRGLATGIMKNLKTMMSQAVLRNRTGIVCSGNALRQNRLLVEVAEEVFQLPVRLCDRQEEAACGAAILAEKQTR